MATTAQAQAQALDIVPVDRVVEEAIRAGKPGTLRVLGYGELTLVFGWPRERPEFAVKRLPPFRDAAQLDRYGDLLSRYTGALCDRGVRVVPTELRAAEANAGEPPRAYLVQPMVPRERHLNLLLRDAAPETGAALLDALVGHVAAVVDPQLGL